MLTNRVFPFVAVLDVKLVREMDKDEGTSDNERYIPPPYAPLQDVTDVSNRVRES